MDCFWEITEGFLRCPSSTERCPASTCPHEAAVGKIAEEEITYLMTRGLSEDEATSAIVRGFLDVEIKGVPPALQEEMRRAVHTTEGIGL